MEPRLPRAKTKDPSVDGNVAAELEMPGHLLRRCHQIAVAVFLDECHAFDLTPPQYVTLAALATSGPLDKASIGRIAALDRTTMAVVLANLRERGFVETRPSQIDRRAKMNEITASGRAILAAARPYAVHAQRRILAPLAPSERAELLRLLAKVADENNLLSRAPLRVPRPLLD
jgi:DNA-binding MarR family transcriptional regulator